MPAIRAQARLQPLRGLRPRRQLASDGCCRSERCKTLGMHILDGKPGRTVLLRPSSIFSCNSGPVRAYRMHHDQQPRGSWPGCIRCAIFSRLRAAGLASLCVFSHALLAWHAVARPVSGLGLACTPQIDAVMQCGKACMNVFCRKRGMYAG